MSSKPVEVPIVVKTSVNLPESLFEQYKKIAGSKPVNNILEAQLQRYVDIPANERILIVAGQDRVALEALFGGIHILTVPDLIARIKRLCNVKFGEVDIPLTAAEAEEIDNRARRNNRTPQEEVEWMIKSLKPYMFNR